MAQRTWGIQEIARHLGIVGLHHVSAVEVRVSGLDHPRSLRRLRRRRAGDRRQLEPERDPPPKSRDDAGARVCRLPGHGRCQSDADGGPVVEKTDRGRVADAPALVAAVKPVGKLAVGTVSRAPHPATERGHQPDERVKEQDDQTEDDQFHHGRARLSPRRRSFSLQGDWVNRPEPCLTISHEVPILSLRTPRASHATRVRSPMLPASGPSALAREPPPREPRHRNRAGPPPRATIAEPWEEEMPA